MNVRQVGGKSLDQYLRDCKTAYATISLKVFQSATPLRFWQLETLCLKVKKST